MAQPLKDGSAYLLPAPTFDEDLVRVGRGTPMGELFRRYWHPVLKSDKLHDLPVQVKALGEDIILFRKPNGAVGAVYPRCIHRGTTLLNGKVTERGIRCCYHGWTFETDGRCVDQPCEKNRGEKVRDNVRQPWYPAEERYGFVFVYLGPLECKPALPRYDLLENIPEGWEVYADDTSIPAAGAGHVPFNWLQSHENGMDWAHVAVVHEEQFAPILAKGESEFTASALTDRIRGHAKATVDSMVLDFRNELVLPNVRIIPDPLMQAARPDGKCESVGWTLPQDDTNAIIFTAFVRPVGLEIYNLEIYNGKKWSDLTPEEHQRFPGDFEAQAGQGLITFHSEEHLAPTDKGIVLFRRLLRSAAKDVEEGRHPPLAFGPKDVFVETWSGVKLVSVPTNDGQEAPAAHKHD